MTVGNICTRETIIASPEESALDASKLMQRYKVGSVVIVETNQQGSKPVGIVTDRDMVMKVIAQELKPESVLLKDIMSPKLLLAKENDSIYETLVKMRNKVVRRIPISNDAGYLIGMLSIDDIFEFLSNEIGEMVRVFKKEQAR